MFRAEPILLALAASLAGTGPAGAQATEMNTCRTRAACEAAAAGRIAEAALTLERGLFQDAASQIYPIIQTQNEAVGISTRLAGHDALADILEAAGLPGFAASQMTAANRLTGAPSSARLLREARLLAAAGEEDAARAAYARSEALATRAANLGTVDALAADSARTGDGTRADSLRAARRDIARRFDRACSAVRCRSASVIEPRLAETSAPDYPAGARRAGLSGTCSVTLNVTEDGEPADIAADCSDPAFVAAALDWAGRARFSQRFVNGAPEPAYGIVLPVEFALQ